MPAVASRSIAPRSVAAAALALPALALVVVAFVLGLRGGGVTPEEWLPVALAAGVAVATLVAVGALPAAPRRAWPALAAVGALLGWSALSLLWSQAPDATLESVARTVLLALAFGVGATCAARPRAALALAVAIGAGGAATALVVLAHLLDGDLESFLSGRLSYPVNYANGAAALMFLAVPPLVALAAAEPLRPLVRAPLGALAALVLAVGATAESRGGTIAIVGALVAVPVLARDRGRAGLTVLAVALPVLAAMPVLAAGSATATRGDLRASGVAALLAAARGRDWRPAGWPCSTGAGAGPSTGARAGSPSARVAVLVALGLRRPRRPRRQPRVVGRRALGRVLAPRGRGNRRRRPTPRASAPASRTATTTGASRGSRSLDHPLGGVGAGAFAVPWFRERTHRRERDRRALLGRGRRWPRRGSSGSRCSAARLRALAGRRLARAARARRVADRGGGARRHARLLRAARGRSTGSRASPPSACRPSWPSERSPPGARPARPGPRRGAHAGGRRGRRGRRGAARPAALRREPRGRPRPGAGRALHRRGDRRPRSGRGRSTRSPSSRCIVKSTLLAGDGDAAGAQAAAEEAIDRGANDWTAWAVLAEARLQAGDVPGARAAVERVAELNPRARQLQGLRETLAEPTPQP